MVAKFTALADWKLAHLLTGDAYDSQVAQQAWNAVQVYLKKAEAIRTAEPEGITALFDSLAISGRCMVTVHSSRPAAGAEHSLAHFWEITHQLNNLPVALHGEKTGVASVIIAQLYERLRGLSSQEAARRLENFHSPNIQAETTRLRSILGPSADLLLASQLSFLGMLPVKVAQIKANLISYWDQVQAIASTVPTENEIANLLQKGGAVNKPAQIHVKRLEVEHALE